MSISASDELQLFAQEIQSFLFPSILLKHRRSLGKVRSQKQLNTHSIE
ncbi:hypothetical protein OCB10_12370 [Bacillus cereus]|nr:hypothetical protein [Bacillus cereus]